MRRAILTILCVAVCAGATPCGKAQSRESAESANFAQLEQTVADELVRSGTPGAAVAIVADGRVIFAKGFGVASVETKAPVTTEMLFRIGSSTKMFNGVALAALARQGKLDLDAPVAKYIKGLDASVGRVTTAQLLSHTAGLRDFAAPAASNDETAFAPAIKTFKSDIFFTEPGAIHSYSSPGYWLAGVVLEEVSGRPYADAMAETVFVPLGMQRTTFRPLVAMTYPIAAGHAPEGDKGPAVVRPAANNTVMWPGGSIYSNVLDLTRFVTAFLDGGRLEGKQILPAEVFTIVAAPHTVIPGSDGTAHYGFGLIGYEDRGVRILQHGGFSRGYGSMVVLAPDRKFAVVVLTNRSGGTLPRTVAAATEMFLKFGKADEDVKGPAPTNLGAYVGVYEHLPSQWDVFLRDGKLFVRVEGKEEPLVHVAAHRFAIGTSGEEIVFVPNASGAFEHIFLGLYSARRR
jgi:CubicO group peptidase (beta-lactamase class C family)